MNLLSIKGIGEKVNKNLNKKGIYSIFDMLFFFPIRFEDRTKKINYFSNEKGYFIGKVINKSLYKSRFSKNILNVQISSDGFIIDVVFFNSLYLDSKFKHHKDYVFYGNLNRNYSKLQCVHPSFDVLENFNDFTVIDPIYSKIYGVSQNNIKKYIKHALELNIDEYLIETDMSLKNAIIELHFPTTRKNYLQALKRFILHEFLMYISDKMKVNFKNKKSYNINEKDCWDFYKMLDFELTNDQLEATKQIYNDLISNRSLNRLIQGDVSSGKSVVAYFAMYLAYKNSGQAAYMAPTEILAIQQYEALLKYFNKNEVVLLTSNIKNKKDVYDKIENGSCKIIVGTQALIQSKLKYNNLMLVVIDEEHRFGVNQREALIKKGDNVDLLTLSATPIPRTLSKILYSHINVSIIAQKPSNRKEIITKIVDKSYRERLYSIIDNEVEKGHTAYIIYPLIDENEDLEFESIEENVQKLSKRFKNKVAFIHGKMNSKEKNEIIDNFKNMKNPILVSTTVVEVGIDVSNASVMIIEDAYRYGLSQLHQLRGRIGRSNIDSYCYLVSDKNEKERLKILERCSDGFEISKEDLRLRGPGEIRGLRQHGDYNFYKADIYKHINILNDANNILKEKENLERINLWRQKYESNSWKG